MSLDPQTVESFRAHVWVTDNVTRQPFYVEWGSDTGIKRYLSFFMLALLEDHQLDEVYDVLRRRLENTFNLQLPAFGDEDVFEVYSDPVDDETFRIIQGL